MIDPSTQLAAMIRAQFSAQYQARTQARAVAGTGKQPRAGEPPTQSTADQPGPGITEDSASLQQLVSLRVRALAPDDPQRKRKAFRIFLESVLTQTLGRERLDGPRFDQLVDTVLLRMEEDSDLREALQTAGDLLLVDALPGTQQLVDASPSQPG